MSISAVTIIKNGLKLGYPFVESIVVQHLLNLDKYIPLGIKV